MRVHGFVRPPGDKSLTHRALIFGALARGRSEIRGALTSADTRTTARVVRQLGASAGPLRAGSTVTVTGAPWRAPRDTLHCGNSGTTARLMLGALAGHAFACRLTGDASLRRRPMRRVTEPLVRMGAGVTARGDGLPLTIRGGALRGIDYRSPVASAQIKSAILLAALTGGVRVTVHEPRRSRDHTERLLQHLGLRVEITGATVGFDGTARRAIDGFAMTVPGDPSSAAFLVGAAVLAEGGELVIENVGVNPTRSGFLEVLRRMGAAVDRCGERDVGGEPVADLLVRPAAALRGADVSPEEVPSLIDEIPLLAALAARASGETRFRDVGELRVKESDRLGLLARNLRSLGVDAEVQGDDLVVRGASVPPRGRVETGGDHRIAMAFAVLGTVPGAAVELAETDSVGISYPGFFDDLAAIRDG
jgi:3-phosphoshikimate 1-carboxyvinyltransferase